MSGVRSLYVCYLSVEDPLVETQVIAYLAGLAQRGHVIHLLSFEPARAGGDEARRRELRRRGIEWHTLRYHRRPSLPATIFDGVAGALKSAYLVRRHRLDVIHARSHVPAAAALLASRMARCKLVFDIRGLMAEEYRDAGRWSADGLPFRITKRVERRAIRDADEIVVLTTRVRDLLFGSPPYRPVHVIPCCADLAPLAAAAGGREAMRDRLGLADRTVLVYVGKFTGWYLQDQMVRFFKLAQKRIPDLFFLVLSQSDHRLIEEEFERSGVGEADRLVSAVPPEEVPDYLAAADAGIAFIKPLPSKVSSSPTKVGEYLGAGLPVVTGRGVGDVDALLERHQTGVFVDRFHPAVYEEAAGRLKAVLGNEGVAAACRQTAEEELSLERIGVPLYAKVYEAMRVAP